MTDSTPDTSSTAPRSTRDTGLAALVWLATLGAFWPLFMWFGQHALSKEQLTHAFIVLVFSLILIMREDSAKTVFRFGRDSTRDLFIAYALSAIAIVLAMPLAGLVGVCFVFSAALLFIFGPSIHRLTYALLGTFFAFLLMILWFPRFDWPLRIAAGRMSMWLLDLIGAETQLGFVAAGEVPKLLLAVNGRPFEVAAECNGFGLISGSILMSVLFSLYRRITWWDKLLSIAVAGGLGFVFNSLRILVIVLLAPHVGDHYLLMHEIIGLLSYAGGLSLIWWLIKGLPNARAYREKLPKSEPAP